jgi:hypothetical protein
MTCSRCHTEYCYLCGANYKHGMHAYPHRCTETAHYRTFGVHLQDPMTRFADVVHQRSLFQQAVNLITNILALTVRFCLRVILWLLSSPLLFICLALFTVLTGTWLVCCCVAWLLHKVYAASMMVVAKTYLMCSGKKGKWWWRRKVNKLHGALRVPISSFTREVTNLMSVTWRSDLQPRLGQCVRLRQTFWLEPRYYLLV